MPSVNVLSGDYLVSGSYFEVLGTGVIPRLITSSSLVLPNQISYSSRRSNILAEGTQGSIDQSHGSLSPVIYSFPGTNAQLARGIYGSLYNPWSQGPDVWGDGTADILWNKNNWTSLANANELEYSNWLDLAWYGAQIVEDQWIAKIVSANKYFKVDFTRWDEEYTTQYWGWAAVITPLNITSTITGLAIDLDFGGIKSNIDAHSKKQVWTLYTGSNSTGPFTKFAGLNAEQFQSTGIIISSGSWLPDKIPGTNFFAKALIQPIDVERRLDYIIDSGSFALKNNEKIGIGINSREAKAKLHVVGDIIANNVSADSISANNIVFGGDRPGPFDYLYQGVYSGNSIGLAGSGNKIFGSENFVFGNENFISGRSITSITDKNFLAGSGNNVLGAPNSIVGSYLNSGESGIKALSLSPNWLRKASLNSIFGGKSNEVIGQENATVNSTFGRVHGVGNSILGGIGNSILGMNSYQNAIIGGATNEIVNKEQYANVLTTDFAGGLYVPIGQEGFTTAIYKDAQSSFHNTIYSAAANRVINCKHTTLSNGRYNLIAYLNHGDIGGSLNRVFGYSWNCTPFNKQGTLYGREASRDIFIRGDSNVIGGTNVLNELPGLGSWNSQFGESGVFIWGNRNTVWKDNVAIFNDNRVPFFPDFSNTFYIQNLYGISFGGFGLGLRTHYRNSDLFWWMSGDKPTGINEYDWWNKANERLETGNYLYLGTRRPITERLEKIFPFLFKPSRGHYDGSPQDGTEGYGEKYVTPQTYVDRSGQAIREVRWNFDADFSINIGDRNKIYPAILTCAYPVYPNPTYENWSDNLGGMPQTNVNGEINELTGVATIQPTSNIVIGYNQEAALFDIMVGTKNKHYYQTLNHQYDQQAPQGSFRRSRTYTKNTPSPEDMYNTVIGHWNTTSGSYVNVLGSHNQLPFSKGPFNILGTSNIIIPQKYFYPVPVFAINKDGLTLPVMGTWNLNSDYGYGDPAERFTAQLGHSNIIGSKNEIRINRVETSCVNILGDFNNGDELKDTAIVGHSNYSTGVSTKILGNRNMISSRRSNVIGDSNFIQDGERSTIIGSENMVTNVIIDPSDWIYYDDGTISHPHIGQNRNAFVPNDMVIIGRANTVSELDRTSVIGNHNWLEGGKSIGDGEGQNNTVIGHGNYSDALSYYQDNSTLGNANTLDGARNNTVGSYNFTKASFDANILGNHNFLQSGVENNIAIGNDHLFYSSGSVAIGQGAHLHSTNQTSISAANYFQYSDIELQNGGAAQKTILTWYGIVTGATTQEIYLDGRAYSPNLTTNAQVGDSRAKIPTNRMWNGKLSVSIADRDLSYVRNITRGFYAFNMNGTIPTSPLSNYGSVEEYIPQGSSHGAHSSILTFSVNGDRLVLNAVGLASQRLVFHVVAEFLDTYIPTSSQNINMFRYSSDGKQKIPVVL